MNYIVLSLVLVVALGLGFFFVKDRGSELESDKSLSGDDKNTDVENEVGDTLDLSGEGLTKVPDNVFTKTAVVELDLSNNNLSGALPGEVRHLSNLRVLDLSDNDFTGVPAEVGQLSKLEVLDLSNNSLTGLPQELGNLKNLKTLDLRGTNYSAQDLVVIQAGLSSDVTIKTD